MTHSAYLDHLIESALREDIGHGDLTTSLILRGEERAMGHACAKGDFVLAGQMAQNIVAAHFWPGVERIGQNLA